MALTYNGVTLRVEQSTVDQRAWYSPDGKDLLGTHFVINVRSVWSPQATNSNGDVGIASVAALRQTLMTPRAQLVFSVPSGGAAGSTVLLRSPHNIPVGYSGAGTAFRADANNGPAPVSCNVRSIQGERTCIVDYTIETWLTECSDLRGILSHRWEMTHAIDQDYYTKRIITGVVVFSTEWLTYWDQIPAHALSYQVSGDMFRAQLFPPIPSFFKRDYVSVTVSKDGTQMVYEVHDTEQPYIVHPSVKNAITRVAGCYTELEGVANVNPFRLMRGAASALETGLRAAQAIAQLSNGNIPQGIPNPISVLADMGEGIVNTFPVITIQLNLEVWGRRTATKQQIINALIRGVTAFNFAGPLSGSAVAAAGSLLGGLMLGPVATAAFPVRALFNSSMFTIDLAGQHAKFEGVCKFPSIYASALRVMGLMPGTNPIGTGAFPNDIANLTTADGGSQGPGFANQSRSQYITEIATAALKSPCSAVVAPPNPPG